MTSHPSSAELTGVALGLPDRSPGTDEHLAHCPVCREQVAEAAAALARLRDAPAPAMPAEVAARMQQAIAVEARRRERGEHTAEQQAAEAARAKANIGSFGENLPSSSHLFGPKEPGSARPEVLSTGEAEEE